MLLSGYLTNCKLPRIVVAPVTSPLQYLLKSCSVTLGSINIQNLPAYCMSVNRKEAYWCFSSSLYPSCSSLFFFKQKHLCVCGSQRTTYGSWSSSSTMCIKLRLPGILTSTSFISPPQIYFLFEVANSSSPNSGFCVFSYLFPRFPPFITLSPFLFFLSS